MKCEAFHSRFFGPIKEVFFGFYFLRSRLFVRRTTANPPL